VSGYDESPRRERLEEIRARLVEARRELDALIGDAYLRPRASIVPVHFLDLASAVEKLRWAEKEWRELDRMAPQPQTSSETERADAGDDLFDEPVPSATQERSSVGVRAGDSQTSPISFK
jgi:hypothetical protein